MAPDTSGHGLGCDNMSVIIVAILNGRTQEEWRTWVTDRVKQNYGYETPRSPHQIYPESRLKAFKTWQEAVTLQQRERLQREAEQKRASSEASESAGVTIVESEAEKLGSWRVSQYL